MCWGDVMCLFIVELIILMIFLSSFGDDYTDRVVLPKPKMPKKTEQPQRFMIQTIDLDKNR